MHVVYVARQLITCGEDDEVHVYSDLGGVADSDREEFSVSSSHVTALTSYKKSDGSHSIALGMDDNTVQAFSIEVRGWEGLERGGASERRGLREEGHEGGGV